MKQENNQQKMWAVLLHLGSNMWSKPGERKRYAQDTLPYHETMFCDKETWHKITAFLPGCGINTVLVDMGEGVKLDSHPEIAIPGSWEKDEFREELDRLRGMGLTPLPKFNFSCAHNAWMQEYGYMVGTPEYIQFCCDIIRETIELFDRPEFFHLGLQEENAANQANFPVTVVRSFIQMREDAQAMFKTCLDKGVRPWIWVEPSVIKSFGGEENFCASVPKEVLVSNICQGYVAKGFPPVTKEDQELDKVRKSPSAIFRDPDRFDLFEKLEAWGYEQAPAVSTYYYQKNGDGIMDYCKECLQHPEALRGYVSTPWVLTDPDGFYGLRYDAYEFGMSIAKHYPNNN